MWAQRRLLSQWRAHKKSALDHPTLAKVWNVNRAVKV